MAVLSFDIDQGSGDWDRLRLRIPTASRFSDILTPKTMKMSASRKRYAVEIICARLMNWQPKSLETIEQIEAGRQKEPFAVAQLEEIREVQTRKIGLIRTNDLRFGASPDRVVMDGDRVAITVECKAPTIPMQMNYALMAELAKLEPVNNEVEAYRCQRQGQMKIAECDEAIFFSYHERMPPVYVRNHRDEPFIKRLTEALEQFDDELCVLEEKARSLGAYQAFTELVTPAEAAYDEQQDIATLGKIIDGDMPLAWGG